MAVDSTSPLPIIIEEGTEDELICMGYRDSLPWKLLCYLLCIVSCGSLLLLFYWKPAWAVKFCKTRCPLANADTVLLKDRFGICTPVKIVTAEMQEGMDLSNLIDADEDSLQSSVDDTSQSVSAIPHFLIYFEYCHIRYIWQRQLGVFKRLRGLDGSVTCATLHDKYQGLSIEQQRQRRFLYGLNSIEVEVKPYLTLLVEEVLNPFYIFQVCSVILWCLDDYFIYSGCIVFISTISISISLYQTRKQSQTLHDMVSSTDTSMQVVNNEDQLVGTACSQLVPGDVIVIPPHGCQMTCDAVLISGNAIVNESMLTGESVPVTKTPLAPTEANEVYSPERHRRHTLFCGTNVIQTRYYGDMKVKAVIIRVGFTTAKGQLVRSILFPRPIGFKFYEDAMRFIMLLACLAGIGMIYSVVSLLMKGVKLWHVILRALDVVTVVVPPALPAAMTVGTVYAQRRLRKQAIFCISPPRINVCGKVKLVCFDKTGTLTEDGLDMWGVVPCADSRFQQVVHTPADLPADGHVTMAMATCHSLTLIDATLTGDPLDLKMFNSVHWILDEPGKDTSRFDSLIPTVVRPINTHTYSTSGAEQPVFEVGIVRQLTFSSDLQRMSVITRVLGASHMDVYAKGAPEKIASLCRAETVPDGYHRVLHSYTERGFRVIGLAWKPLEDKLTWHQAQRMSRNSVESDLTFIGLIVMENMLKPQTTAVIQQLNKANIRTVMATGDNMLTAISVARQCHMVAPDETVVIATAQPPEDSLPASLTWHAAEKQDESDRPRDQPQDLATAEVMVASEASEQCSLKTRSDELLLKPLGRQPLGESSYQSIDRTLSSIEQGTELHRYHFAMSGKTFSIIKQYFPDIFQKVAVRGTVFARMSPDQKSQLVEQLQTLGYCVGMCGDGANDCGALKAADAGISLSEAEASIASPFTSATPNIECVPTIIREGRAALVTSFGIFKYMALYSIIQFVSVMILYSKDANLGDWMFLYVDLVITTTVAILMGHTGTYHALVAQRPLGSLIGPRNIISILVHVVCVIVFQAAAYFFLTMQTWYVAASPKPNAANIECWETTVIFFISSYQYLMLAFCFSKGPPYRKHIWTNVPFLLSLILLSGFTTWLLLKPVSFLAKLLQIKLIPDFSFRLKLLGFVVANFIVSFMFEAVCIPSLCFRWLLARLRRKKVCKNKYKVIERKLAADSAIWPPIGHVVTATGSVNSYVDAAVT